MKRSPVHLCNFHTNIEMEKWSNIPTLKKQSDTRQTAGNKEREQATVGLKRPWT